MRPKDKSRNASSIEGQKDSIDCPKKLDRRSFVKVSATAVGAAAASGHSATVSDRTDWSKKSHVVQAKMVMEHFREIGSWLEAEGGVLVMAEDKALRKNRLALLQAIVALADGVADFSQMEGF